MPHTLRFFDDYGSGWLWAGDAAARAHFDVGPLDDRLSHLLTPETRAEAEALSAQNAATLNWDEPQTPLPFTAAECDAFNTRTAALMARMQAELGADYLLLDHRMILRPTA